MSIWTEIYNEMKQNEIHGIKLHEKIIPSGN